MKHFVVPPRSALIAASAFCFFFGLATASSRTYAQAPVTLIAAARVSGFACNLDDGITAVGVQSSSNIQVSVGTFTNQRVDQIRKRVGNLFVAFRRDGHDYVITDPSMVVQALAYFQRESTPGVERKDIPADANSRLQKLIQTAQESGKVSIVPL